MRRSDAPVACTHFPWLAQLVACGLHRTVLVVGADTLSCVVDYKDRTTCVLFGDGAGAMVLSASADATTGVCAFRTGAHGQEASLIRISPDVTSEDTPGRCFLRMDGRRLAKFALQQMTDGLCQGMQEAGMTPADVRLMIPHQINQRLIESACKRADFPPEKVFVNIGRYGNTSAASVPIALDEARRSGRCGPGDWVLLAAFGAGLTWASAALRLYGRSGRLTLTTTQNARF